MKTQTAEKIDNEDPSLGQEPIAQVAQSQGEVAVFKPPRLPWHDAIGKRFPEVDKGSWKALVEAIYPAAKSVDAVILALTYCKARNLDPFKRVVHIVPMWDSKAGAYSETVWPGISELRTTAFRTKQYAGCDETEFGPMIEKEFTGEVWENKKKVVRTIKIKFHEWARVTIHRVVHGTVCKFVGPKVFWLESYAAVGKSDLPNDMWRERSVGQLEKCFSADTEVLTDMGFQRFDSVTGKIMQVAAGGITPTDAETFYQPYYGPMVTADGDSLNFCVTPNHDMITQYGKIEAGDLFVRSKSNAKYRIPLVIAGEGLGSGIPASHLVLAAAIVCDGWRKDSGWNIGVSRQKKIDRLNALALHNYTYVAKTAGKQAVLDDRVITTQKDKTVFCYGPQPGIVSEDKLINRDLLTSLSAEEAGILLDAIIDFDGSVTANGTRRFYSSNSALMGQFELLAVMAGCAVSKRSSRQAEGCKKNEYITVSRKRSVSAISVSGSFTPRPGHKNAMRMEPANPAGTVWCCRVPSGVIVVRRNGLSMLCGNCAEAGALRRAFPEELGNEYAAEEMEGRRQMGDVTEAAKALVAPAATAPAAEAKPATITEAVKAAATAEPIAGAQQQSAGEAPDLDFEDPPKPAVAEAKPLDGEVIPPDNKKHPDDIFLEYVEYVLAKVTKADDLEATWNDDVAAKFDEMLSKGRHEDAYALLRKHEIRLGG